jgi:hypothetical protein
MERDPIDSAGPALRGFRLQILYTLSRLIEPQTALSGQLWPEGIEDLAILDADGSPREAVQVKGYGASLTLSDLKMTLKRAVKIAQDHPDCVIRLLSFGPFGPELTDAWAGEGSSRNRVATKLRRMGLGPSEIERLFSRFELCEEQEQDITEKIQRFLRSNPLLGGEASHASDILCQRLYVAAERRDRITHADLIKRLTHVGRYLHARSGYWRDWASVIEPLDPASTPKMPSERLHDQFQQGMSARYEHILADCDIQRHRWLERISTGFEKTGVVIVHGASGQGKSALAYRWLHLETPSSWRLQIKLVENRREALQIAETLSSHAQAVSAPIVIYIDVRPHDQGWPLLVEELARIAQIRLLVTVREEDWLRAILSRSDVGFEDISLSLDRAEAQAIYDQLARPETPGPFLSFDEAWARFLAGKDGEGPLMEFVYLVNRSESLRDRLSAQVNRIRTDIHRGDGSNSELRLLALVAFASALGGRLEVAPLRKRFPSMDLGFLVDRIAGMVEGIQGQHGSAWNMMLDLDLAELNPHHRTAVWKDLDMMSAEGKAQMQSVLDRQPPKSLATVPAREWLIKRRDPPMAPTRHPDWAAMAEVSDWVGRWGVDGHLRDWLVAVDLNLVSEDLDLRTIADLIRGCWELDSSQMTAWLDQYREDIIERFRRTQLNLTEASAALIGFQRELRCLFSARSHRALRRGDHPRDPVLGYPSPRTDPAARALAPNRRDPSRSAVPRDQRACRHGTGPTPCRR